MRKHATVDVSVVICVHTEKRLRDIFDAVTSCNAQSRSPRAIIIVVDHNRPLLEKLRVTLPEVTVIENRYGRGLCGGRNTGIEAAATTFVAFLDDDAEAEFAWLERLAACFDEPAVEAVGGLSRPLWETRRPIWMPDEFLWTLGCSYRGMPVRRTGVRSLFGGCMCVKRSLFYQIGGFDERLGRGAGPIPIGGEEAEFFMRARKASPHCHFVYEPGAAILHKVSRQRATFAYFVRRCFAEGLCKAALSRISRDEYRLASEREYALSVLPAGVMRSILETLRGDITGFLRAFAIVAGFAIASVAYLVGRILPLARHDADARHDGRIISKPREMRGKIARHGSKFDVA